MARSILITGGAGFVGSNLANTLIDQDYEVTIVDNLDNGLVGNVNNRAKFVQGDLASTDWMAEAAQQKFDAVVHCAAQASNAISFKDPFGDLASNQISTLRLIQFCNDQGINRLIYTSTMSAYGDASEFPTPPTARLKPQSYYAIHKAAAEEYLKIASNLDWTVFRLYTTYGSGQNLANLDQGLVKIFLSYILKDEPVTVRGSGDRLRDIIHVNDVVRAISMAVNKTETLGQTYNLGFGRSITVSEIIKLLARAYNGSESYPVVYQTGDRGDPFRTLADISNCQRDFGWSPMISPEEGLEMTAANYRKT